MSPTGPWGTGDRRGLVQTQVLVTRQTVQADRQLGRAGISVQKQIMGNIHVFQHQGKAAWQGVVQHVICIKKLSTK